ncbi:MULTISPECIES: FadR/GntR family transcriptional regulator [unclassified Halanaerobium]|uniref:FadR/GntR family transcriptional regulator n=1 Tax=unclassified Halanaerobium TaxID=2641197 RepID=UPI000E14818A|nr:MULTISPECIES: FadR/GntR family transcriptional regulator [unclassified Halanaerobium]RCW41991.1 GntR family transcriptional regulator [Halanaerobium sp. MA284_MarDTE_T2]RCW79952.1 GntR family transcriptional regulator [Halanaerobium sp. DL-01]
MNLKPVKKERISDQIIDQIFKLIVSGNLKPGDKIPSERKMTELFDVSRNSIREAIKLLEMLGFLVSKRGDGTYIADMSSDVFEGYINKHNISNDNLNASEVVEARMAIEPSIAKLAAERRTEKQLNMLENIVDEIENNSKSKNNEADLYFHRMLAKASQNKVLEETLNFLIDYTSEVSKKSREINETFFPLRIRKKVEEHRTILEAIKNQDSKKASVLMYRHLKNVKIKLERLSSE